MSQLLKKVYKRKDLPHNKKLELTVAARNVELSECKKKINKLQLAAQEALTHVQELRDAWQRGALSDRDGKGGLRSNRNVAVEVQLREALKNENQAGKRGRLQEVR